MSVVFKAREFPGQEFSSKEEMFKAVYDKQLELISIKKAELKKTDSIECVSIKDVLATKGLSVEDGYIYSVINTTKYMDSHNDVHLNGIWNKSVSQQEGKIHFVSDHVISIKTIIAWPKDVEMMLKEMAWSDLGADYDGNTQALIFKVAKDNIRMKEAKEIIEDKIPIQHSVRMSYVEFNLAMDSSNPDHADAKANWDNTIGLVANKEKAIERGYYWTVSEAKIFKEGSMVVAGSNDITPMIMSSKETGPPLGTQKDGPPAGTRTINKQADFGLNNF